MPRMENAYHSPYDQHEAGGGIGGVGPGGDGDDEADSSGGGQLNHYEAVPSMLARNPSGSLYIPAGKEL